jgi:hypothetical protein
VAVDMDSLPPPIAVFELFPLDYSLRFLAGGIGILSAGLCTWQGAEPTL